MDPDTPQRDATPALGGVAVDPQGSTQGSVEKTLSLPERTIAPEAHIAALVQICEERLEVIHQLDRAANARMDVIQRLETRYRDRTDSLQVIETRYRDRTDFIERLEARCRELEHELREQRLSAKERKLAALQKASL